MRLKTEVAKAACIKIKGHNHVHSHRFHWFISYIAKLLFFNGESPRANKSIHITGQFGFYCVIPLERTLLESLWGWAVLIWYPFKCILANTK